MHTSSCTDAVLHTVYTALSSLPGVKVQFQVQGQVLPSPLGCGGIQPARVYA